MGCNGNRTQESVPYLAVDALIGTGDVASSKPDADALFSRLDRRIANNLAIPRLIAG
jgi:hypothetical protein